ncbi:MAG: sigma-70 family RNA polymerase sigma factor [Nitriliruptoraceae bacterium]
MIGDVFPTVLAAARLADQAAWDTLYRDIAGPLAGFFRSRGAGDVDNLIGDTFLHVARNLSTFTGDENQFRAWVFTIAHRRLVDVLRREQRRPATTLDPAILVSLADALNDSDDELDRVIERLDSTGALNTLLSSLTADQAEVLVLRFGADLDATSVGVLTGRSTNAVAAITARALARLRQLLEQSFVT